MTQQNPIILVDYGHPKVCLYWNYTKMYIYSLHMGKGQGEKEGREGEKSGKGNSMLTFS